LIAADNISGRRFIAATVTFIADLATVQVTECPTARAHTLGVT